MFQLEGRPDGCRLRLLRVSYEIPQNDLAKIPLCLHDLRRQPADNIEIDPVPGCLAKEGVLPAEGVLSRDRRPWPCLAGDTSHFYKLPPQPSDSDLTDPADQRRRRAGRHRLHI